MSRLGETSFEGAHEAAIERVRRAFGGSVVHALPLARSTTRAPIRTRLVVEGDGTRRRAFGVLVTTRDDHEFPSWFESSSVGQTSVDHFTSAYIVVPLHGCATTADVEVLVGVLAELAPDDALTSAVYGGHPDLANALTFPERASADAVAAATTLARTLIDGAPLEWALRRVETGEAE